MKTLSIQPPKKAFAELAICSAWFAGLISPLLLLAGQFSGNRILFQLLLFFTGWLSWTFTEYCMHRFKDHGEHAKDSTKPEKLHHYHHRHPTEIAISHLQRVGLIILCAAISFLAIWLDSWFTIIPGFIIGFTSYTFIHWFLHLKISALIFPELHRFHIHHHCKHPDKCFGITVTWWDHLFNTIPFTNTMISERILTFYYKKEKNKRSFSMNCLTGEKIHFTENQSA